MLKLDRAQIKDLNQQAFVIDCLEGAKDQVDGHYVTIAGHTVPLHATAVRESLSESLAEAHKKMAALGVEYTPARQPSQK